MDFQLVHMVRHLEQQVAYQEQPPNMTNANLAQKIALQEPQNQVLAVVEDLPKMNAKQKPVIMAINLAVTILVMDMMMHIGLVQMDITPI